MDCNSLSASCEDETMTEMTTSNIISRLVVIIIGIASVACFSPGGWDGPLDGTGDTTPDAPIYERPHTNDEDPDSRETAPDSYFAGSSEIAEAYFVPETNGWNDRDEGDDPIQEEEEEHPGTPEEPDDAATPEEPEDSTSPEEPEVPSEEEPQAAAPHTIFVTSRQFKGDLVGEANDLLNTDFSDNQWRDAADGICQYHAQEAQLDGTFVAFIDGTGNSIFDIITDADGPWARLDGFPIADFVQELQAGHVRFPVAIDETGEGYTHLFDDVWTGQSDSRDCLNWSSDSNDDLGTWGLATATSTDWRARRPGHCDELGRLYCIEVGDGGGPNDWPENPVDDNRLVAFTTEQAYDGDLVGWARQYGTGDIYEGREAADYLCNESAQREGLQGSFHALLTSNDGNALVVFETLGMDGPWYTSDGFLAVNNLSDLQDNVILAPFYRDAAGNPLSEESGFGFTGLTSPNNCEGWTTNNPDARGGGGLWFIQTDRWWRSLGNYQCDWQSHLYCFQEG